MLKGLQPARKRKGFTQKEFAELMGVDQSYISHLENNVRKNPSMEFMEKAAATLGIAIAELIEGEGREWAYLSDQIEAKRAEMNRMGAEKGLGHPDTITLSRELDEIMNKQK